MFFLSAWKRYFSFVVIALKLVSVLFSTFPRIHSPCTLGSLSARFFFFLSRKRRCYCKTASVFLFAGRWLVGATSSRFFFSYLTFFFFFFKPFVIFLCFVFSPINRWMTSSSEFHLSILTNRNKYCKVMLIIKSRFEMAGKRKKKNEKRSDNSRFSCKRQNSNRQIMLMMLFLFFF